MKSKAIQVNAFWANLELEGGKIDFFLPFAYCSGRWNLSYIEIFLKWFGPFKTSKICQAKLLSYFLRFFWVSLENFLVFFLFLLILQPNFLIKRFLIKRNECSIQFQFISLIILSQSSVHYDNRIMEWFRRLTLLYAYPSCVCCMLLCLENLTHIFPSSTLKLGFCDKQSKSLFTDTPSSCCQ